MKWIKKRLAVPVLSELLPYLSADSAEDVIWLKDGSVTQTFELVPKSAATCTDDDLERIRMGLTPLLDQIPDDALLQLLVIRERTDADSDLAAQNWISAHLDESVKDAEPTPRMRLLEAKKRLLDSLWAARLTYQTRVYITLRIPSEAKPKPGARQGPLAHLAFRHGGARTQSKSQFDVLSELKQVEQSIRVGLQNQDFETREVPIAIRLRLIYRFLNPERAQFLDPPSAEGQQDLSEKLSLTDFLETEKGLRLGRSILLIGSLKSLPESTVPALMEGLSSSPEPFALVVTVLFLPQTAERERLLRRQRLAQGMASGNTVRNLVAESQLRDIEDTLTAMISSGQKLVSASFHLLSLEEAL